MDVSQEQFADEVIGQLRAMGESRPMRFDGTRGRLLVGDGRAITHFLSVPALYEAQLELPRAQSERALAARIWAVPMERPSEAQARTRLLKSVVPRIRDLAWFSAIRRQAELELGADETLIDELMLPYRRLNEELGLHLAVELPTSIAEIGNDRLAVWEVEFDELFERALENLRGRSKAAFEQLEPGLFQSPFQDGLDATRMVLTDTVAALPVKGRPVAIAPTHDVLLVAGDEDPLALQQLGAQAEEALGGPRVNSALAFRLEDGAWRPWLPERTHPAFGRLRLLQLQSIAAMYARQREVLAALLRANDVPIAVMPVRVVRTVHGDIVTTTVWTEGQDVLLPKTDRLELVRLPPDGSLTNASTWSTRWDVAERLVGKLMTPTDDIPQRFRINEFPDDATLEQLAEEGKL